MKKYLSTGMIILLPFALTVWVIIFLFDLFSAPLYHLISSILQSYEETSGLQVVHHATLVTFLTRLAALILTFLLILLLGYLGRKYFFRPMLRLSNHVMQKIPIVGTIFRLTKDLTEAVLSSNQKTFKRTVIIPFPSPQTHTLGFVTGDVPDVLKTIVPGLDLTVFVPTAPHPISGYVLFSPKAQVHNVAISTEETLKFLVSCGVIHPTKEPLKEP
jgi:uncharacterized membrane protein